MVLQLCYSMLSLEEPGIPKSLERMWILQGSKGCNVPEKWFNSFLLCVFLKAAGSHTDNMATSPNEIYEMPFSLHGTESTECVPSIPSEVIALG